MKAVPPTRKVQAPYTNPVEFPFWKDSQKSWSIVHASHTHLWTMENYSFCVHNIVPKLLLSPSLVLLRHFLLEEFFPKNLRLPPPSMRMCVCACTKNCTSTYMAVAWSSDSQRENLTISVSEMPWFSPKLSSLWIRCPSVAQFWCFWLKTIIVKVVLES